MKFFVSVLVAAAFVAPMVASAADTAVSHPTTKAVAKEDKKKKKKEKKKKGDKGDKGEHGHEDAPSGDSK